MHKGQFIFTQVCKFLPKRAFDCLVNKLKFPTPYFIGAFGLNCFTSAHKYWKLTLT